jgi:hypothetical protein
MLSPPVLHLAQEVASLPPLVNARPVLQRQVPASVSLEQAPPDGALATGFETRYVMRKPIASRVIVTRCEQAVLGVPGRAHLMTATDG